MGDGDGPVVGVGDGPGVVGQVKEVVSYFVGDGEYLVVGGRHDPIIGAKVREATCY
jgi:hypothetical protein